MKEPRKQYRKEKGIPEPKNVMDSFSTHAEDKAYIEWLESQLTTPTIMSRHREVAEAIRDALIKLPSDCTAIEEELTIESILSTEYGEGDKLRKIRIKNIIKEFANPRESTLDKATAKIYELFNDTHLPEDKGSDEYKATEGFTDYAGEQKFKRVKPQKQEAPEDMEVEKVIPVSKEGSKIMRGAFEKQEAPNGFEPCIDCHLNICHESGQCWNPKQDKQEAPLSAIEWIKKEGWDLRGIKSVKFMHKYSVDKEITPLELMHQYAHRIDPDKLAEEIMAKNVSGFLNRMQSDFEDKVEESIKQTIKEHLK